MGAAILSIQNLEVVLPIGSGWLPGSHRSMVHAVQDVSFDVNRGMAFGIVGESGCGKSTLARTVVRLREPTRGRIVFDGQDISHQPDRSLASVRHRLQMVFQDPYASLDPRQTVRAIVGEAIAARSAVAVRNPIRIEECLDDVGLHVDIGNRYPHQLSGGQRQRVGIARALATQPEMLILDEPVSALDVSVQARILNLIQDLRERLSLAMLFISHNLAVVKNVSDRIGVMYLGRLVEVAAPDQIFRSPMHPYTIALLSAIPEPDPARERRRKRIVLSGELPSSLHPPSGCPFHTRCPIAIPVCSEVNPALKRAEPGHTVACHRSDEATELWRPA